MYYSPLLDGARAKKLDPVQIYAGAINSVVTVHSVVSELTITDTGPASTYVSVLGTGFIVMYDNSYFAVTNFHVVDGAVNSTVTFSTGDSYRAKVVGSDGYSDVAILSIESAQVKVHPLQLGSSSTLKIGESVVAIGNPFGFSGTITVGIVSQVGRTMRSETSRGFAIADIIQFSAQINPGNSGGPLINSDGGVVGITTAVFTDAQGLGFAIPSDTIARELPYLVKDGKYNKHPYLGVQLVDMNYGLSRAMRTNVTWGVLIQNIVPDGPASRSGFRAGTQRVTIEDRRYLIGGDIIISLDGNKIVDSDALSTYLERHAVPGQTIRVGIIRSGSETVIPVELGTRPPIAKP